MRNLTSLTLALTFAALATSVGASGCRGWTSEEPPVHLMWNMDTQEKGKPYYREEHWADKRMMRMPVEGTVARGYLKDNDELELGIGADGKAIAKLPDGFTATEATVARGANRYQVYCAPCHGKNFDGKGHIATRTSPDAKLPVIPPAMTDARLIEMPAGQIYAAIRNGVNNGNMPPYAVQIPVEDRWALVAFLCTLQTGVADANQACTGANKKAEDLSNAPPGRIVWKEKGCNACHSTDGKPMNGPTWKGLFASTRETSGGSVTADEAYLRESIMQPNAKIVNGFQPIMPPLPLSEKELSDVIDYIKTLK